MERLILNIKDSNKLPFLLQIIKQFDFVEVEKVKEKKNTVKYDFFASAGLWANRKVSATELREKAWNRRK